MSGGTRPVPPAVEEAHRILADGGPLSGPELKDRLRSNGFVVPLERIQRYPELYPSHIQLTVDGRLRVASVAGTESEDGEERQTEDGEWFRPSPARVPPDRIGVLDIETTGVNPAKDLITGIALVRLDGTPVTSLSVRVPAAKAGVPADPEAIPIGEALQQLRAALEHFDLLIGQNLPAFDVPFLQRAAQNAGLESLPFAPSADSIHLSMLVDVAMPNRGLADLLQRYEKTNPAPIPRWGMRWLLQKSFAPCWRKLTCENPAGSLPSRSWSPMITRS